jgi:acyl carrier protein
MMINGEYKKTEEWLDTRDVMECAADGSYYICGRIGDSVIGENGENINPDVLEQSFRLADALNFSILGLPREDGTGEALSMIVAVSPYLSAVRLNALINDMYQTNETLPMASRIEKFYFTYDELAPKTAIKIGRQYVRRGLEQGTIHLIPAAQIRSQAEQASGEINLELKQKVCGIVAEELGMEAASLDIDAHIMHDFGAGSLQYFSMLSKLAEEFAISAEVSENDYRYTIREICQYIEEYM